MTLVNGNAAPNVEVLGGQPLKEMTKILTNSSRIMEVFCCTVFKNGTAKLLTFEGGVNFVTCGNNKSCDNICSSEKNEQGIEAGNVTNTGNASDTQSVCLNSQPRMRHSTDQRLLSGQLSF